MAKNVVSYGRGQLSLSHPRKARSPMIVTESGRVTEVRPVHPSNAASPNAPA